MSEESLRGFAVTAVPADSVPPVADPRLIVDRMSADEVRIWCVQQRKAAEEFFQLPDVRAQLAEVERCPTGDAQRDLFSKELQPKLCRDFRRWKRERGLIAEKRCWPVGLRPCEMLYAPLHALAEGTLRLSCEPDLSLGITLPGTDMTGGYSSRDRKELSREDDDAYRPIADLAELLTWLSQFELNVELDVKSKSRISDVIIEHGYRWLSWFTGRETFDNFEAKDVVTRFHRLRGSVQDAERIASEQVKSSRLPGTATERSKTPRCDAAERRLNVGNVHDRIREDNAQISQAVRAFDRLLKLIETNPPDDPWRGNAGLALEPAQDAGREAFGYPPLEFVRDDFSEESKNRQELIPNAASEWMMRLNFPDGEPIAFYLGWHGELEMPPNTTPREFLRDAFARLQPDIIGCLRQWLIEFGKWRSTNGEPTKDAAPSKPATPSVPEASIELADGPEDGAAFTANELMMVKFTRDQSCIEWTATEWVKWFKSNGRDVVDSTIKKTPTWKAIMAERERQRQTRQGGESER